MKTSITFCAADTDFEQSPNLHLGPNYKKKIH